MHLFHGIVLVLALAVGIGAPQTAHADSSSVVLDQSFTFPPGLGVGINGCCRFVAQTFTAGLSGTLYGVNIDVDSVTVSPFPLHVEIRTVGPNGEPSSTILGETTLASSTAPLSLLITFPQTIEITAGVQYAIVVSFEGAPPPGPEQVQGVWLGSYSNPYPGGALYLFDGARWFQLGSLEADGHFQTYVTTIAGVSIDIKPGGFPNSINPVSRGKIPVAILTTDATDNTATFDATTVDPLTVRFGATGTEAAPVHYGLEDVDGDGDLDLILHFNTQSTGIKCGDISATLTGETFSGQAIRGTDSIRTVGCRRTGGR
jgi:hypothetical protein